MTLPDFQSPTGYDHDPPPHTQTDTTDRITFPANAVVNDFLANKNYIKQQVVQYQRYLTKRMKE